MKLDVVGCLHITMVPKTNFMKKYLFLCLNVDNYICLYFLGLEEPQRDSIP